VSSTAYMLAGPFYRASYQLPSRTACCFAFVRVVLVCRQADSACSIMPAQCARKFRPLFGSVELVGFGCGFAVLCGYWLSQQTSWQLLMGSATGPVADGWIISD
jgi:hypothetical protein